MASREQKSLRERTGARLEEAIALEAPSRRLRLALADKAISRFAQGRPIRLLDAGTGDGLPSLSLAERHPDWEIAGMDLNARLLAGARQRAANRGLENISFHEADLTKPLPMDGFDVVMALECLSEIPDDRAALGSMSAALAPEGLFVVQVPDAEWKPVLKGSPTTWREEVRHGYRPGELQAALQEAGLERIEVTPTFRTTVAAAQEVRDRIKKRSLALRAAAFPAMAAAVRLERIGATYGPSNALFALARRPRSGEGAHGGHSA
jgi:ubiquinone/menaquinone biosynthesis C-methylase UbiE